MIFTFILENLLCRHITPDTPRNIWYTFYWRHLNVMATQITSNRTVRSITYLVEQQTHIKRPLAWSFLRGIHRWPVEYPGQGPTMLKDSLCRYVIIVRNIFISGLLTRRPGINMRLYGIDYFLCHFVIWKSCVLTFKMQMKLFCLRYEGLCYDFQIQVICKWCYCFGKAIVATRSLPIRHLTI